MSAKPETRLQELHIHLPVAPKPVAKYKTAVLVGNMLYVSGHGPAKLNENTATSGRVGENLSLEQGKDSARADGPLVEANGAVIVDTTGRTVAEILDEINTLLEARR